MSPALGQGVSPALGQSRTGPAARPSHFFSEGPGYRERWRDADRDAGVWVKTGKFQDIGQPWELTNPGAVLPSGSQPAAAAGSDVSVLNPSQALSWFGQQNIFFLLQAGAGFLLMLHPSP